MIRNLPFLCTDGISRFAYRTIRKFLVVVVLCISIQGSAVAQDKEAKTTEGNTGSGEISLENRETMALDSTATQWSFQLAYQVMPDYHDDTLDNGQVRPQGNTD